MEEDKKKTERQAPERLRVNLDRIAHLGESIGRHEGLVCFAAYGIPGEEVEVEVRERKSNYARGRVVEVVEASPDRVEPRCPHFADCGGCHWQHIAYPRQLELKREIVDLSLRRIGHFEDVKVEPVMPSPKQWGYRNQGRFTMRGRGYLGFNKPYSRRFTKVDECLLMTPEINEALKSLQGRAAPAKHQVVIRHGVHTGKTIAYPEVDLPDGNLPKEGLEEEILGRRFCISPMSFFQVNTLQAENLVKLVLDMLAPTKDHVILDAYSGVGAFSLHIAPLVKKVIGIEEAGVAIEDAKKNAEGLDNVEFIKGKVEEVLPRLEEQIDAVIVDPPRAGAAKEVLQVFIESKPEKIVYVSCEPSTLARDLRILVDGGYEIRRVQPIDMFPQTYHIETVCLLERK